jgi:Lipase maturation factor
VSRRQKMNASFDPLHLVNTYGAFGSVTRTRYEAVVEGTDDPRPGPDTVWREYEFRGKPGDVRRRPPQVAPYHLRLDWLMWFVGIDPGYGSRWLRPFLRLLLEGDRATLRLLRRSPFPPESPPAFVRVRLYRYRFTTRQERRDTGAWWSRTPAGVLVDPVSLAQLTSPSR